MVAIPAARLVRLNRTMCRVADRRPTFITGDKHYEVVSEDELIVSWGSRETYRRCTKDTNPVLKYKEQ